MVEDIGKLLAARGRIGAEPPAIAQEDRQAVRRSRHIEPMVTAGAVAVRAAFRPFFFLSR